MTKGLVFLVVCLLNLPGVGWPASFPCSDVACLVASLHTANSTPEEDTITLAAGTYSLTAPLPIVTSAVVLAGAGAPTTVLARLAGSSAFSVLVNTGTLTVQGLTLRGGLASGGGGVLNYGTLVLHDCLLMHNTVGPLGGGGLLNYGIATVARCQIRQNAANAGGSGGGVGHLGTRLTVLDSVISENLAQIFGGGLWSGIDFNLVHAGPVSIERTTIAHNLTQGFGGGLMQESRSLLVLTASSVHDNAADMGGGGGILTTGQLEVRASTLARNAVFDPRASGTALGNVGGTALLMHTTIVENISDFGTRGFVEALFNGGAFDAVILVNSILYGNGLDCTGEIYSWDHNIFGDPWVCVANLWPNDLVGDPHLGAFVETATPGQSHFPIVQPSMAINEGGQWLCPPTDQLGQPRVGQCDIGAVEFQPPQQVARRGRR